MKKFLIFTLVSVFGLVALLAVAVLVGPQLVNWGNHKGSIEQFLRGKTGYTFVLGKDIRVSALPTPTIRINSLSIKSFTGKENLFHAKDISTILSWEDLLSFRLGVESLSVINPTLNLSINEKGEKNWEPKRKSRHASPIPDDLLSKVRVDKISLLDGTITFQTPRLETPVKADDVDITLSAADLVKARVTLSAKLAELPLKADGQMDLTRISAAPIRMNLRFNNNAANIKGMVVDFLNNPSFTGQLNLEAPELAADLKKILGEELIPLADDFGADFNGTVRLEKGVIGLSQVKAEIGKTAFSGQIDYAQERDNRNFAATLVVDVLDLNRLGICPEDTATTAEDEKRRKLYANMGRERWSDETVDLSPLKNLELKISVNAENIRCGHRLFESGSLLVNGKDNILSLDEMRLNREGGYFVFKGRFDLTGEKIDAKTNMRAEKMPSSALLSGRLDKYVDVLLDGRGELNFTGNSLREWLANLEGGIEFESKKGRIAGLGFEKVEEIVSMMKNLVTGKATRSPNGSELKFLKGQFSVKEGVLTEPGLLLDLGDLKMRGEGKISLIDWTINYEATMQQRGRIFPPVAVQGPLDDPGVKFKVTGAAVGAGVGAAMGGPVGAAVGAAVGTMIEGGKKGDKNRDDPQNPPLPFDIFDQDNLQENIRRFLEESFSEKEPVPE